MTSKAFTDALAMRFPQYLAAARKADRIKAAEARKAVIMEAAHKLAEWADKQLYCARQGTSWDLEDEHAAATACIDAFGTENLEAVLNQARDELIAEHSFDIKEGCFLDEFGYPREARA